MATIRAYTTIEQSRKLAEILPLESADYFHAPDAGVVITEPYITKTDYETQIPAYKGAIPCWSLSALMNFLPSEFTEKGKYSETTYKIDIRKYALTEDVDVYQIAYGNYKFYEDGSSSWKDIVNTGEKENLIDAAFEIVCWLKENNKL